MNRRRHPRLEIRHPAEVEFEGERFSGCQIVNFSAGGLFLEWGDSGLEGRLEAGYWEEPARKPVRIELPKARLGVAAALVHVTRLGFGVAFSEDAGPFHSYLQEQGRGARQEPPSASPGSGSATPVIVRRLHDKFVTFLRKQYAAFPVVAREDLIFATDQGLSGEAQSDLFFAVTRLEQQAEALSQGFFNQVEEGFQRLLATDPQSAASQSGALSETPQELELVDKEDFDEWVLLNGIAYRLDGQLGEAIFKLNLALTHLLQRPVKSELNPFTPISLLQAIKPSVDDLDFTPQVKQIVFQAFSRVMFTQIDRFYGELLACLAAEGIGAQEVQDKSRATPAVHPADLQHPSNQRHLRCSDLRSHSTRNNRANESD